MEQINEGDQIEKNHNNGRDQILNACRCYEFDFLIEETLQRIQNDLKYLDTINIARNKKGKHIAARRARRAILTKLEDFKTITLKGMNDMIFALKQRQHVPDRYITFYGRMVDEYISISEIIKNMNLLSSIINS